MGIRGRILLLAVILALLEADHAAGTIECPERLANLTAPNCGESDPECPLQAPFHQVRTSHDGLFRYIQTSYCPPYDWSCLANPKGRRPCTRWKTFKIPVYPGPASGEKVSLGLGLKRGQEKAASSSTGVPNPNLPGSPVKGTAPPMLGAIGVLVNGVVLNAVATKLTEALPLDDAEEVKENDRWVDAGVAEEWMNDGCHGHLSGGGNYHVHAGRWTAEQRKKCGLPVDLPGLHSEQLGWAFDGFAIYGPQDEDGRIITSADLDECGGHAHEDEGRHLKRISGYHYHLTDAYPYALECYHGCPESSNNERFADLKCERDMMDHIPLPPPPVGGHRFAAEL
eukprot:TRINITY_DN28458_c0_g1_i1.p1 TRINITY_DN28458_c0_g1~~TRINITY_DN28458_c0_g1_i1.p1  ORF type:complete len:340 (-),score=64.90 TRINITY_DN28458_c0_g1_i1:63-1082(-)